MDPEFNFPSQLPVESIGFAILIASLVTLLYWKLTTRGRSRPHATPPAPPRSIQKPPKDVPKLAYSEDAESGAEVTNLSLVASAEAVATTTVVDEDTALDEPTGQRELIVLSATAQSDQGLVRQRNEDRVLALESRGIFAVADGMGGARGGGVASELAVQTLRSAFEAQRFDDLPGEVPRRAGELVSAMARANRAIYARSIEHRELRGMGTTMSAARFSRRKQRVYIGHVGDSRVYRFRDGVLTCLTTDHTMGNLGWTGPEAPALSRALGVWPRVPVDIVLATPRPGDLYLLCSDGLTRMLNDTEIGRVLAGESSVDEMARSLIAAANGHGGKDNCAVIVILVEEPRAVATTA